MNMSNCNGLNQNKTNQSLIVLSSFGVVSLICCVLAVGLVFYLKLHKHFLYRLAMYQVLSSMLVSLHAVLAITLSSEAPWWDDETFNEAFNKTCNSTAFLLLYFEWVKLLFTTMLSFHLFCLAVCLKDFNYHEITSLSVFLYCLSGSLSLSFQRIYILLVLLAHGVG